MTKPYRIGTVVRVGVGEDLLMIISRYPLTIINDVKGYFHYSACTYPIGVEIDDDPSVFNHEDITEVLFEGYINPLEEKLQAYYQRKSADIKYPKLSINE
ncbi:DUF4176 domain-containing protein [Pasteurella sp. PK-2025]|uniref:DUF4176 domain-containing protein n=1 Tax=Pasteurella sp. PK-2025 TaxID=3413133 RepID=UPI003C755E01